MVFGIAVACGERLCGLCWLVEGCVWRGEHLRRLCGIYGGQFKGRRRRGRGHRAVAGPAGADAGGGSSRRVHRAAVSRSLRWDPTPVGLGGVSAGVLIRTGVGEGGGAKVRWAGQMAYRMGSHPEVQLRLVGAAKRSRTRMRSSCVDAVGRRPARQAAARTRVGIH